MIDFKIDAAKCIRCSQCVNDCPMRVIDMEEGVPFIKAEKEEECINVYMSGLLKNLYPETS